MKSKLALLFLALVFAPATYAQEETIAITGRVTDFDGNPIDSSIVLLLHADFTPAYETYTDSDGYYILSGVKKGRYAAMYVLRPEEYPRQNAVPKEDMRLEFWAWNVIADGNMTLDAHYQRLELYGTTVFEQHGGYPTLFVYFRPMSLTRYLAYEEIFTDKARMEAENTDISVLPEYLDVEVYADGEPLEIHSVQAVEEYVGGNRIQLAYLVQTARPATRPDKPYIVFRVVATDRQHNEKGENLYFYERKQYR